MTFDSITRGLPADGRPGRLDRPPGAVLGLMTFNSITWAPDGRR